MVNSNITDPTIPEKSIGFIEKLLKVYLEDRDFPLLITMLDNNISWFGTGHHEVCKNIEDAVDFLENEQKSWQGKFRILKQWYEAIPMNEEFCMVIGELRIREDGMNTILADLDYRFSMVCHIKDNDIKLYHTHFSSPSFNQDLGEFVPKDLTNDYNAALGEQLLERTQMLKEKTLELEALANNIVGGIEMCIFDENLTILYVNDGFLDLTGYSRDEIFKLKKHISMMLPKEVPSLIQKVRNQLKNSNKFSAEYRMIKKDGTIIWVLCRGILISDKHNQIKLQSNIVDITEQKETEIKLKISEKRYNLALDFSDITMFEYDVITKDLILLNKDSKMYDVPSVVKDGPNTFVKTGIIEPDYAKAFLEMYQQIHDGAYTASCYIKSKDAEKGIHDFELSLTNIFDDDGKPVRAIGVRKNITQLRQLQREQQYGKTLASNQRFIYEVNITRNQVIAMDKNWAAQYKLMGITNYTELKAVEAEKIVSPEFSHLLLCKLSKENITNTYESGKRLIHFDYRRKINKEGYHWFRKNISIIKDDFTGDIIIRCYIVDINANKMKELKLQEEQQLYEQLLSKSSVMYEVNITQNLFLSGHEHWGEMFDIKQTSNYSDMMDAFSKTALYPDDKSNFNKNFLKHNVLDAYAEGKNPIICDYRRPDEKGSFIWVRCTLYLYEDSQTGDIKGYSYIEDINTTKKRELALIYSSEHDALTSLYNKSTVEKYITDFLSTREVKCKNQAFFIIDIDYFKSVNDNFGHAFGDVVLTQVAHKINSLFRSIDIIGRVGGDEFVVLLKNISNKKIALVKAQEICDKIADNFIKNGIHHKITVSIGIAFYREHGKSYEELYKHSDTALYISKENGRNRYTVYHNNMKHAFQNPKPRPVGEHLN